ncbi:MAG: WD40 repeat domain-containing serine/threonine protein kinase, partial [Verrucomicrobiota bacterium]
TSPLSDTTLPLKLGSNDELVEEVSPQVIGPYTIHESLGKGGFGDVYRATQESPVKREVAIKLLKPGMDSREIIKRFQGESQALAMMEHPNIATVLDAGMTDRGLPFFVMELVRGSPITSYCDDKKLKARERLDIFNDVCAGLQHAHQKGIIHRDLKPSNILVTEIEGRHIPKIIDFGIAKAITGDALGESLVTEEGMVMGTPQYMSPEQAQGVAYEMDTRTDIFSMGVILYELLTGRPPLTLEECQAAGRVAVFDLIQEKIPRSPSSQILSLDKVSATTVCASRSADATTLRKFLRQDLDWVVLKALEKEKNRRYDSVAAFSDDIRRFLKHLPVTASPPSRWYQLKKFARRQRGLLTAISAIFITVVLAAVFSIWQAKIALEQSQRAQLAERQSSLQRDAAQAINLVRENPIQALKVMNRVAAESKAIFGRIEPSLRQPLFEVLERGRLLYSAPLEYADFVAIDSQRSLLGLASVYDFRLLKAGSKEMLHRFPIAESKNHPVSAVSLVSGEDILLVGDRSGEARLYNAKTGSLIKRWQAADKGTAITQIVGSRETANRVIVLDAKGLLSFWDRAGNQTGTSIDLTAQKGGVPNILATDLDCRLVAAAGAFGILPGYTIIRCEDKSSPNVTFIHTPERVVSALRVRSNGEQIMTGHHDGSVQLWRSDGQPVSDRILAHRSPVWQVAYLEGRNQIVTATDSGEARIWESSGSPFSAPLPIPAIKPVALAPLGAGEQFACITDNIEIWQTRGSEARPAIYTKTTVDAVLFPETREEEMVLTLSDGRIEVREWKKTGRVIRERTIGTGALLRAKLNHNETLLAVSERASRSIRLLNFPDLTDYRSIEMASD